MRSKNILVDENIGLIKLIDFENTKNFKRTISLSTQNNDSMYWNAPERFNENITDTPKIDIWSLGCTIYEMVIETNLQLNFILL